MTSRIQQEITPGMVVVDVGAHIGYHTILFSKLVKDNGRVLAFEPSRREFNLLYENVKINEASNTKVFNIALYDKVSEMSLDRDQLVIDAQETLVKTDTLDNVITNEHVAKVDLIKIDVEGAELKILIGSKQILTSMHPRLLIEVHPSKLVDFNDSLEELQTLLQDLGYSIEEFDSDPSIHWFCQVKA